MIEAFSAMQAAEGAASPGELAGGISTALTHTFLGLFLAIPCLAAFGMLRTVVDRLTVRGRADGRRTAADDQAAEAAKPGVGGAPPRIAASPQPGVARKAPLPTPTPSPAST